MFKKCFHSKIWNQVGCSKNPEKKEGKGWCFLFTIKKKRFRKRPPKILEERRGGATKIKLKKRTAAATRRRVLRGPGRRWWRRWRPSGPRRATSTRDSSSSDTNWLGRGKSTGRRSPCCFWAAWALVDPSLGRRLHPLTGGTGTKQKSDRPRTIGPMETLGVDDDDDDDNRHAHTHTLSLSLSHTHTHTHTEEELADEDLLQSPALTRWRSEADWIVGRGPPWTTVELKWFPFTPIPPTHPPPHPHHPHLAVRALRLGRAVHSVPFVF